MIVPPKFRFLSDLVASAFEAADTMLYFSSVFTRTIEASRFMEMYFKCRIRLQTSRTIQFCASQGFNGSAILEQAISRGAENLTLITARHRQEAQATVGQFWADGCSWAPLPRREDTTTFTPEELDVATSTRRDAESESSPDSDLVEDDQDCPNGEQKELSLRALDMEQTITGFLTGQMANLIASIARNVAPALAITMLFNQSTSAELSEYLRILGATAMPLSSPCSHSHRVLLAWLLAADVELSVTPQAVAAAAHHECCLPFRAPEAANSLTVFFQMVAQSAMCPHPVLSPMPTSTLGEVSLQMGNTPVQIIPGLSIVSHSSNHLDDIRGVSYILEAFNTVLSYTEKYRQTSQPLRKDLLIDGGFLRSITGWVRNLIETLFVYGIGLMIEAEASSMCVRVCARLDVHILMCVCVCLAVGTIEVMCL